MPEAAAGAAFVAPLPEVGLSHERKSYNLQTFQTVSLWYFIFPKFSSSGIPATAKRPSPLPRTGEARGQGSSPGHSAPHHLPQHRLLRCALLPRVRPPLSPQPLLLPGSLVSTWSQKGSGSAVLDGTDEATFSSFCLNEGHVLSSNLPLKDRNPDPKYFEKMVLKLLLLQRT